MRLGGGKEKEDSYNEERVWGEMGRWGEGEKGGGGGGKGGKGSEEEMEEESYMSQVSKKFHSWLCMQGQDEKMNTLTHQQSNQ